MDCTMLPSGGAQYLSRPSNPSLIRQSASAVRGDGSLANLPLATSGLSEDDAFNFVGFLDMDPSFFGPTPHDFDIRSVLGSSPDQLPSLHFHDDVSCDAFAYDAVFSSTFSSSPISAPFLQQSYAPLTREMHQNTPVLNCSSEFSGVPSLPLPSNQSGWDSVMHTSQLNMSFQVECPGNSEYLSTSFSQYRNEVYYGNMNQSVIGLPNVQLLPSPTGQDDLRFSSEPLKALSALSISGIKDSYLADSDSHVHTPPFTMHNNFPTNSVHFAPVPSHALQPCSIPLWNGMQSDPSRISSTTRSEVNVLDESATGEMNASSPISDALRFLEGYKPVQFGDSNASDCPDGEGASSALQLQGGRAYVEPCRKQARPRNRGRLLPRTGEPNLLKISNVEVPTLLLKRKETRTKKSQSKTVNTSTSGPPVSCRKRRARKSVEKKLNEAILIFNNMDSPSAKDNVMSAEETIAAGLPSEKTRSGELIASPKLGPGAAGDTRCTENNVRRELKSVGFSDYDSAEKDEAAVKIEDKTSSALEAAISVSGKVGFRERILPSHSEGISGVQEEYAVRCIENTYCAELPSDETPFACFSEKNAPVVNVTAVDGSGKEDQDPIAEVHSLHTSGRTMGGVNAFESTVEAEQTEIFQDSRNSRSAPYAEEKVEIRANTREGKAEEMTGTNGSLEVVNEVQSETKSEERDPPKSAKEAIEKSASASAAAVGIIDNAERNAAAGDHQSFERKSSSKAFMKSFGGCEANSKRQAELIRGKDDDYSSSITDETSNIAAADNSKKDIDDGSCQRHPSSPSATVCDVDPTAEINYETTAASSFSEGSVHESLTSASYEHFKAASHFKGSGEVDHGQLGQQVKPDIFAGRRKSAVGSHLGADIQPAANCIVEMDVECSEAFTSSISDTKVECEMSMYVRRETRFTSRISRKAENVPDSSGMDETAIICDKLPGQDLRRMQNRCSLDPALQRKGKFALLSNEENIVKSCADETTDFCTRSMEENVAPYSNLSQDTKNNSAEKWLATRVFTSSDPTAEVLSGEDYDRQSDLDVESSIFDESLVRSDIDWPGKYPMIYPRNPSWEIFPSRQQPSPLDEPLKEESLNPHQGKILRMLSDFIESGYGVGAENAADELTDDHEEPDIYAELSRGTVVVPATVPKSERDKVHRARCRSTSKQAFGRIRSMTEAGETSSSSVPPENCNSDSPHENDALNRTEPEKVYRTRSRSRSGWGH